jgi:hypothetical protein
VHYTLYQLTASGTENLTSEVNLQKKNEINVLKDSLRDRQAYWKYFSCEITMVSSGLDQWKMYLWSAFKLSFHPPLHSSLPYHTLVTLYGQQPLPVNTSAFLEGT